MEGYGQTECNAAATVTVPGETEPGHVGPPIPSIRIKLADVPDMNYFAANSVGEVGTTNIFSFHLALLVVRCVSKALEYLVVI